jgi:hypothetical protein
MRGLQLRAFETGRVHGIKAQALAATASTQLAILVVCHSEKKITVASTTLGGNGGGAREVEGEVQCRVRSRMWDLDDWVLDAHLIRADRGVPAGGNSCEDALLEDWKYVAVGYAHNVVEIWEYGQQVVVSRYCCQVLCARVSMLVAHARTQYMHTHV